MVAAKLVTIAVMLTGATANVYCPIHHCLRRIAAGSSASSFSCESYPELGRHCGFEGDDQVCECDGHVKYGNYIAHGKNATWTAVDVKTKIGCNNKAIGLDPMPGAKVCICVPRKPSNCMSVQPAQSAAGAGLELPKCLIFGLETMVGGGVMFTNDLLYSEQGVNQGVLQTLLGPVVPAYFGSTNFEIVKFDKTGGGGKGFHTDIKVVCNAGQCEGGDMLKTLEKLNNDKAAAQKVMEDASKKFATANAKALGPAAALATMVSLHLLPKTAPETAQVTPQTTAGCATSVLCPAHHCLRRIAQGDNASSFSCEQYPEGHKQCAFESNNQKCVCDGHVKYGNFRTSANNATWSAGIDVTTNVTCSTASANNGVDPIAGAKVCLCAPRKLSHCRSTQPAMEAFPQGNAQAPQCLAFGLETLVGGGNTPNSALWADPYFVNRGVIGTMMMKSINNYFGDNHGVEIVHFDETGGGGKGFHTTLKVGCGTTSHCLGSPMNALKDMTTNKQKVLATMVSVMQEHVKANAAELGGAASLAPFVGFNYVPTAGFPASANAVTASQTHPVYGNSCVAPTTTTTTTTVTTTTITTTTTTIITTTTTGGPTTTTTTNTIATTTTTVVTTTTGASGGAATASKVFSSSATLTVANAAAFVASAKAQDVMKDAIVASHSDITAASQVAITSLTATRRLGSAADALRRLGAHAAGNVRCAFEVTFPATYNKVLGVFNSSAMKSAIESNAHGVNVTVTKVEVTAPSLKISTTKAPDSVVGSAGSALAVGGALCIVLLAQVMVTLRA